MCVALNINRLSAFCVQPNFDWGRPSERVSEQRPLFDVCPTRVSLSHSIGQTTRLRAFAPSSLFMWMKTLVESERAHTLLCARVFAYANWPCTYTQSRRARETSWLDG